MLSRVAEAIYWMSRYLERAENIARFLDVNWHLTLDTPGGRGEQWMPLVSAMGDHSLFTARGLAGNRKSGSEADWLLLDVCPLSLGLETMGSLVYAKQCRADQDNIVAMLSLETLGYYKDAPGSQKYPFPLGMLYPDRGDFVGFVSNLPSRGLTHRAISTFRQTTSFPSEGACLPEFIPGISWSDHWSFAQVGYPSVMVTDTAPFRNPNYHQSTDTADTLDYERMARVTLGLRKVLEDLAGPSPN